MQLSAQKLTQSNTASTTAHEVDTQRLELLVKSTAKVTFIFPVTATILAIIFVQYTDYLMVFLWWSAVLLCSVLRFVIHRRFHARDTSTSNYQHWLKHLLAIDICTGLTAGTSGAFIAVVPDQYDVLIFIVLIAITMESVALQSAIKQSFVGFVAPLFFAFVPCLLLYGGQLNSILAVLSLIHLFLIWGNVKSLNTTLIDSLHLALKNQQLNTELTLSNNQLAESHHKVQQANSAQSRFIADMSHELRTPMQGLLGSIALALGRARDPEQKEILHTAQTAGTTLLNLLNGVIDLSRAEKGLRKIELQPFNLSLLCRELCDLMAVTAQSKGVSVECQVEQGLPETIEFDKNRLSQIILNFLSNAIKFTDTGSVKLSVKRLDGSPEKFVISITDSGPGISEQDLESIFLPYFQLPTGKDKGGAGLGLAICKELSDLIGAKIEVNSELGNGSVFALSFNAKIGKSEPQPAKIIHQQNQANKMQQGTQKVSKTKVLIVEDEPLSRKVLQAFLDSLGAAVTLAINGKDALSQCQQHKFDLILMDCHMPEMDGFTASKLIRETCSLNKQSTIIAMSAHVEQKDEKTAQIAGMQSLVSKPISEQDLRQILMDLN